MTRCLPITLFIFVLVSFTPTAHADTKATAPINTDWPHQYASEVDGKIDIVTITDPTHRQHCERVLMSTDSIICDHSKNRPPTTYPHGDVLALISPPTHAVRIYMISLVAIASGALAASFFVPLAGAVVLRVLSGFVLFEGPIALIGAQPGHDGDIVVYQKEGSTLAVPLRGHHAH